MGVDRVEWGGRSSGRGRQSKGRVSVRTLHALLSVWKTNMYFSFVPVAPISERFTHRLQYIRSLSCVGLVGSCLVDISFVLFVKRRLLIHYVERES